MVKNPSRSKQRATSLSFINKIRGPPPKRCKRWLPRTASPHIYRHWLDDQKHPYMKHTAQILLRGKTFQLFIGPPDGHTTFTTLFRLDASFMMTPHALHLRHLAAPDAPPVLRSKPANLPSPMSTRIRPPPRFDAFKSFTLLPHRQPTRNCHHLPP
jgi:hypothetical protein